MKYKIILTVKGGALNNRVYEITENGSYIGGRDYSGQTCKILLAGDTLDETNQISRSHFRLDVDFPKVRIADLGSINGTYLLNSQNEKLLIGMRPRDMKANQFKVSEVKDYEIQSGDRILIGNSICSLDFKLIKIEEKFCKLCGKPIPPTSHNKKICSVCLSNIEHMQILRFTEKEYMQRFVTKRIIGKGGMGEVKLEYDRLNKEDLAVKRIIPELNVKIAEKQLLKFSREASLSVQLDHPNIVKTYFTGIVNQTPFLVMEYCPYGSLINYLKVNRFTLNIALDITLQILSALEYAHKAPLTTTIYVNNKPQLKTFNGLVHRDLKPQNILIADSSRPLVKICDLGLAKTYQSSGLSALSTNNSVAGSIGFMSRVQLQDYLYSKPGVDIWAVVAILYYMLTGGCFTRNFEKSSSNEFIILHENVVPIQKRKLLFELPQGLINVINKALDDTNELYYQNAEDLANDLRKFYRG